ncbi:MAG: HEAT repeat domain-containing protein [Nitrospirota bacterium]
MKKVPMILILISLFYSVSSGDKSELTQWIKQLEDQDAQVRNKAAMALGKMGEQAVPAIPHLIKLINKERQLNANERRKWDEKVIEVLQKTEVRVEVPFLEIYNAFAELFPLRTEIMRNAAIALGSIGEKAIPTLLQNLDEYPLSIEITAISFLEIGEKAIPVLQKELYNEKRCLPAAMILAKFGEPVIPIFIKALSDNRILYDVVLLEALGEIGEKAASTVPLLIEVLDKRPAFRIEAAIALRKIGEKSAPAIPHLIKMFLDKTYKEYKGYPIYRCYDVSEAGVTALEKIGKQAIPSLIPLLLDPDRRIRVRTAEALNKIGIKDEPALEKIISESEPDIRDIALGRLKDWRRTIQGVEKVGELQRLLAGKISSRKLPKNLIIPPLWREEAEDHGTFMVIPAVPALIQALLDDDEELRVIATKSIQRIGRYALPYLKEALEDEKLTNAHLKIRLIEKHIISSLIQDLLSEDKWTRRIAVKDLQTNGQMSLPYLKQALQDEQLSKVHPQIMEIIKHIEEQGGQKK